MTALIFLMTAFQTESCVNLHFQVSVMAPELKKTFANQALVRAITFHWVYSEQKKKNLKSCFVVKV